MPQGFNRTLYGIKNEDAIKEINKLFIGFEMGILTEEEISKSDQKSWHLMASPIRYYLQLLIDAGANVDSEWENMVKL